MTRPSNTAAIAQLLSLIDPTDARFVAVAARYRLDAQYEDYRGNHVHATTLRGLADLADSGAAYAREDEAIRVLALLCAAAPEVVPVGACVDVICEAARWVVTIYAGDALVVRAVHPDALTAARNCGRALLAREGAEGSQCDRLREAVSK